MRKWLNVKMKYNIIGKCITKYQKSYITNHKSKISNVQRSCIWHLTW